MQDKKQEIVALVTELATEMMHISEAYSEGMDEMLTRLLKLCKQYDLLSEDEINSLTMFIGTTLMDVERIPKVLNRIVSKIR